MQDAILIQQPTSTAEDAAELLLFFHGVGSSPESLAPLAQALAEQRPHAWVVSVRSPEPSGFGSGWQWFSVQGVTEENRPARVAAAMPGFLDTVRSWQRESGIPAVRTTLIGFSQGAIMALEATQQDASVAGRVIAIAGRFAQPPRVAPANTVVHLMHGEQDRVMPVHLSADALQQLHELGAQASLDTYPGLGHGIDVRVLDSIAERLGEPVSRVP